MIGKRIYFLRPSSNESNPEDNNEHYLHEYSEEKSEFCGISNQESEYLLNYLVFIYLNLKI